MAVARATPDEPEGWALVFVDGHLAGIVSPADVSRALEWLSRNPGPFTSPRR